jgi:CspA family cold shock protein
LFLFIVVKTSGYRIKRRRLQHMIQGPSKAQGTVRWFSNEADHGFVCPDEGGQDIHVRRERTVGDGAESFKKGDRVTYNMAEGAKSLWARNVSKA